MNISSFFQNLFPNNFDIPRYLWSLLIFVGASLFLGFLFRLIFGKGSTVNHCLSSAIAILCMYAISVIIYNTGGALTFILAPLPFVELDGAYLTIFPILDSSFPAICEQIIMMIVLSFWMNLLVTWLPKGEKIYSWFFFRTLSIVIAVCLHYAIHLLFVSLFPNGFVEIAPIVLLIILIASLLLGTLKLIAGGALAAINPFLGVFYTFFFANIVGRQISRSILTAGLLTALIYVLNTLEITAIYVASISLMVYIPLIILAIALWYIIGKLL